MTAGSRRGVSGFTRRSTVKQATIFSDIDESSQQSYTSHSKRYEVNGLICISLNNTRLIL